MRLHERIFTMGMALAFAATALGVTVQVDPANVKAVVPSVRWSYPPRAWPRWEIQKARAYTYANGMYVGYPVVLSDVTKDATFRGKDGKTLSVSASSQGGVPCVRGEGWEVKTGSGKWVACDVFEGTEDTPPHLLGYPQVKGMPTFGDGLYSAEGETVAFIWCRSAKRPVLRVGESREEALSEDLAGFEQNVRMEPAGKPDEWRSVAPLAFRHYRFVEPVEETWFVRDEMRRPLVGAYWSDDERLNRIWRASAETVRLCTRRFFVDAVKRDRMPWPGDDAIAFLADWATYRNAEAARFTIDALSCATFDGLADYSPWWVIINGLYRRLYDDPDFIRRRWSVIRRRTDALSAALRKDGVAEKAADRNFYIDWGDRGNPTAAYNVLMFAAFNTAAALAEELGKAEDTARWRAQAQKVADALKRLAYDPKTGLFRCDIDDPSSKAYRQPNLLAVLFGLVRGDEARRIGDALAKDDLPGVGTAWMAGMECIALMMTDHRDIVPQRIDRIWGSMVDCGFNTIFEHWWPDAKGADAFRFYDRPFGLSLCHIASPAPAYLLPALQQKRFTNPFDASGCLAASNSGATPAFAEAKPVWPKGEETTLNFSCRFRGSFAADGKDACVLRATSAYAYRVKLNGQFVGFGPARAAPGFFRMDEWKLSVTSGVNVVEIEACAANNECFYFPKQTPFVQAEVAVNGEAKLATGRDFPAFTTERLRKVPRFSYQRHFIEVYRLPFAECPLALAEQPAKRILPRDYAYPTFEIDDSYRAVSRERVKRDDKIWVRDDATMAPGGKATPNDYAADEVEENPFRDVQRLKTVARTPLAEAERGARTFRLADGEAVTFVGDMNRPGFARFRVTCQGPCRIYLMFDEFLQDDGSIDIHRLACANTAEWIFDRAGAYDVELVEPNAFKAARILAVGGPAEVTAPSMRTYESPVVSRGTFTCSDPRLERLFKAAQRTLAANGVDCVTDCPTRERAGWCGDTYFTGKACSLLTGDGTLEKLFLSNWLMPEKFDAADDRVQLVPAVYPSNLRHTKATYIPNFALWFILQVEDYAKRTGDTAFAQAFRPRLEDVLAFFEKYENADGLLEKLPFWVFVGWSRASKLVQDVSYVSNMQYAEALDAMDRMYGLPACAEKAKHVRAKVREQSWTGEWFCDNAVRQPDGTLKLSGECTEACQYYAMFCGVAPRKDFPALWERMIRDFGPRREKTKLWPKIAPANFIFGRCIREELLSAVGERRRVYDEMCLHFLGMAEKTGTLWEKNEQGVCCSCCHGLASVAAVYLLRDVLGVRAVDPVARTICFEPDAAIPLEHCSAVLPLPNGQSAALGWKRQNGRLVQTSRLPTDWKLKQACLEHE